VIYRIVVTMKYSVFRKKLYEVKSSSYDLRLWMRR